MINIFEKTPAQVEAVEWTTEAANEIRDWVTSAASEEFAPLNLDGIEIGDWVVRDSTGRFTIMAAPDFHDAYRGAI